VFMLTSKSSVDAPLPRSIGLIANVTLPVYQGNVHLPSAITRYLD